MKFFSLVMPGGWVKSTALDEGRARPSYHSTRSITMKTFHPKSLLASLALLTLSLSRADAAIIVTMPTGSTTGSLVITNDIHFTLIGSLAVDDYFEILLDEWVTSDGSRNASGFASAVSLAKNGSPFNTTFSGFRDNYIFTTGSITPNDGFLDLRTPVAFAIGDILTLKAATYVLNTSSGMNPLGNQTFTGNAFLAFDYIGGGARLSANTSVVGVPEPSRALLLLGGFGALIFRRRRL